MSQQNSHQGRSKIFWNAPYALTTLGKSLYGTLANEEDSVNRKIFDLFSSPCTPEAVARHLGTRAGADKERLERYVMGLISKNILAEKIKPPIFEKPVFIVCVYRSGSTLLFATLSNAPEIWSTGHEAHHVFGKIPKFRSEKWNNQSECADEKDSSPEISEQIRSDFAEQIFDRDNQLYTEMEPESRPLKVRLLDKTPSNSFKIPFLHASFPDARFIFLFRDPRENIASVMEGWMSNRYVMYDNLPGWDKKKWNFSLVPGWREMNGKSIAEISAFQWLKTNQIIFDDLQRLPKESWTAISYDQLVEDPGFHIRRLCRFADLEFDERLSKLTEQPLPLSRSTRTLPSKEKWKKFSDEIEGVFPSVQSLWELLRALS